MVQDSSGLAVRIRGMYATALTALFSEHGIRIAEPSDAIRTRFGLIDTDASPDLYLSDRPDRQGVQIRARAAMLEAFRPALLELLPRAVVRQEASHASPDPIWSVEFPAQVKERLDSVRARVTPTITGHHHLKVIDTERVEEAERALAARPDRLDEIVAAVRHDLVDRHFVAGARIVVEHVKPAGQVYQLRGRLTEFDGRHVVLQRSFHPGGHYDSLDLPRFDGDFGHLELDEGSGISIRTYRRRDGTLLGELHNLATPAELYPGVVRYVDLELDVLRAPPDPPRIIDQDDLERAVRLGFLEEPLVSDAWALADEVIEMLEAVDR